MILLLQEIYKGVLLPFITKDFTLDTRAVDSYRFIIHDFVVGVNLRCSLFDASLETQ